ERDIAMVFQNYALYPHMSVFDNMAYGLKIAKVPIDEIKARVDKAAKILELGQYLQRKPRELSGGQRQRVAMGRAIVRQPQVFLFDEPLSNLDAKLRGQTLELPVAAPRAGEAILGVRPEHVELSQRAGSAGWSLKVEALEMLGAERLVYGRLGDGLFTARIDATLTPPKVGDTVTLQ